MNTIKKISYSIVLFFLLNCGIKNEQNNNYFNHIGDTKFKAEKDNPNFKFCDTAKIFHSRGRISYKNGYKGLQNELISKYKRKSSFNAFTGYFFIRLAVNCKNETGRFRYEIVDENHKKTTCPKNLENYIIQLVKNLKHWEGVTFKGKKYDGYTFFIIKFKNGKIINS